MLHMRAAVGTLHMRAAVGMLHLRAAVGMLHMQAAQGHHHQLHHQQLHPHQSHVLKVRQPLVAGMRGVTVGPQQAHTPAVHQVH